MAGRVGQHGATRAFLLKDVILFDGRLFKGRNCLHLHPRSTNALVAKISSEIDKAAIYATFIGNQYFGMWLADNCLTYLLAENEGTPVTTAQMPSPHIVQYEALLGMQPQRQKAAFIREAVLFDDVAHNQNKRMRAQRVRAKLIGSARVTEHPGVFIVRGLAGVRRALTNEMELASRLEQNSGFQDH